MLNTIQICSPHSSLGSWCSLSSPLVSMHVLSPSCILYFPINNRNKIIWRKLLVFRNAWRRILLLLIPSPAFYCYLGIWLVPGLSGSILSQISLADEPGYCPAHTQHHATQTILTCLSQERVNLWSFLVKLVAHFNCQRLLYKLCVFLLRIN